MKLAVFVTLSILLSLSLLTGSYLIPEGFGDSVKIVNLEWDGTKVVVEPETVVLVAGIDKVRWVFSGGLAYFAGWTWGQADDTGVGTLGFNTGHVSIPGNSAPKGPWEAIGTHKYNIRSNLGLFADPYIRIVAPSVGGVALSVDKLALLAPYIGLASTILVATAATAIYVKRVKRRKKKQ